jgi:hypothetical protein
MGRLVTKPFRNGHHYMIAANGCWNWQLYKDPAGYGRSKLHGHPIMAHRRAWILTYGSIPFGMCVCHACDNPACVNPIHLWLGTRADNDADRDKKNRQAKGEKMGAAKLTEDIVRLCRGAHARGFRGVFWPDGSELARRQFSK